MEMSNQINISSHPLSDKEKYTISIGIQELLKKKVIVHSRPDVNKFISDIFTRENKDYNKRMTLNLKMSKRFENYEHSKMESINVINSIQPNVYMASVDLKDAFYFVPIFIDHQKYLKFYFNNLFQFTGMSNGYGPALRVFIKISKAPSPHLWNKGSVVGSFSSLYE